MNTNTTYEIMITTYSRFNSDGTPDISSGTKYMPDIDREEMVTVDLSINEIQDISTRNSSYSKTISLPDTDYNREMFGYISELNVDTGLYNPNKRSKCDIIIDSIVAFSGTIQLKRLNINYSTNVATMECVFYSDIMNFYKNVGDKYLVDLGMTGSIGGLGDHQYTIQNVINSWTQSYTNGYYYPLIDYGRTKDSLGADIATGFSINNIGGATGSMSLQQFYPAAYVKSVVDEIFRQSGFRYDSDFFNSEFYENLLIPFSNKDLSPRSLVVAPNIQFGLNGYGITKTVSLVPSLIGKVASHNVSWGIPTEVFNFIFAYPGVVNPNFQTTAGYYINSSSFDQYYRPSISISFKMEDFTNGVYIDKKRLVWVVKKASGVYISVGEIGLTTYSGYIYNKTAIISITNVPARAFFDSNGFGENYYIYPGVTMYNGYFKLEPGDKSFICLMDIYSTNVQPNQYKLINVNGTIKNNFNTVALPGDYINVAKNLPANIKQKDFFLDICKMFNLYIESDKIIPNTLRIEPRDDYYKYDKDNGYVILEDWTSKIDLSQDITMDILSDTQNKTIKYTYKGGEDYFNGLYKTTTNRAQGDSIKEIDNDFSTGDKKVEIGFETSVMANIPGYINFPVVNYAKQISDVKGYPVGVSNLGIKILQKSSPSNKTANKVGCIDLLYGDTWRFGTYSVSTNPTYSYYPYAGVYNDPYNPTFDLSFEQPLVNFYYQSNVIYNNLFNVFHKNQFEQLTDISGRILTCEMFLTPRDIHNFYFNHIKYLEIGGSGNYWAVNSIKNFDISGRSTATVEFILQREYKQTFRLIEAQWVIDITNPIVTITIGNRVGGKGTIDWGDGTSNTYTTNGLDSILTKEYTSGGTYSISISYDDGMEPYIFDISNNGLLGFDFITVPDSIEEILSSGNQLVEPIITGGVKVLDLGYNDLTDFTDALPDGLETLLLNNNLLSGLYSYPLIYPSSLSYIDFSGNAGLSVIDLSSLEITSDLFTIKSDTGVYIDLSGDESNIGNIVDLTAIYVTTFPSSSSLFVPYNRIKSLNLVYDDSIYYVNAGYNELEDFGPYNVEILSLYNNNLTNITLGTLYNNGTLNLSDNNLSSSKVNDLLVEIDTNYDTITHPDGFYLNMVRQDPLAYVTGAGLTALSSLIGKGFEVYTDSNSFFVTESFLVGSPTFSIYINGTSSINTGGLYNCSVGDTIYIDATATVVSGTASVTITNTDPVYTFTQTGALVASATYSFVYNGYTNISISD